MLFKRATHSLPPDRGRFCDFNSGTFRLSHRQCRSGLRKYIRVIQEKAAAALHPTTPSPSGKHALAVPTTPVPVVEPPKRRRRVSDVKRRSAARAVPPNNGLALSQSTVAASPAVSGVDVLAAVAPFATSTHPPAALVPPSREAARTVPSSARTPAEATATTSGKEFCGKPEQAFQQLTSRPQAHATSAFHIPSWPVRVPDGSPPVAGGVKRSTQPTPRTPVPSSSRVVAATPRWSPMPGVLSGARLDDTPLAGSHTMRHWTWTPPAPAVARSCATTRTASPYDPPTTPRGPPPPAVAAVANYYPSTFGLQSGGAAVGGGWKRGSLSLPFWLLGHHHAAWSQLSTTDDDFDSEADEDDAAAALLLVSQSGSTAAHGPTASPHLVQADPPRLHDVVRPTPRPWQRPPFPSE